MAEKRKVCKNCGFLTDERKCPLCNSSSFADKFKGKVVVIDEENSIVAKTLKIENKGTFALKFH